MKSFFLNLGILFALALPAFAQVGPISITSGQCATIGVSNTTATVGIQVVGTWTGTLQPQIAISGQAAANTQVIPSTSSTPQSTITANGIYTASVAGASLFLLCGNTVASGTALVYLNGSAGLGSGLPRVVASRILPARAAVDGVITVALYTVPTGADGVYRVQTNIVARILSSSAWVVNADITWPAGIHIAATIESTVDVSVGTAWNTASYVRNVYLHAGDVVQCGTLTGSGANTGGTFDVAWTVERVQ